MCAACCRELELHARVGSGWHGCVHALTMGRQSSLAESDAAAAGPGESAVGAACSDVGFELLRKLGQGRKSVQELCETAMSSLAKDEVMQAIARLAMRPQKHWERDLHRWADTTLWRRALPELYAFKCTKSGSGRTYAIIAEAEHHCLLPHEVLGCLAARGPELTGHVCGTPATWVRFWREAEAGGGAGPAPGAAAAGCVPLGMHGDDAGVQVGEKITVLTWGALTCPGPTWDSRILFTAVKGADDDFGATVLDEAFRVMAWSLNAAAAGVYPAMDHTGAPWASGSWRAAKAGHPLGVHGRLVELRGDWKFLRETLRLQQHYNSRGRICHLCSATKERASPEHFSNFSRRAPCRGHLTTHAAWAEEQERLRPGSSPLLLIHGFNIRMVQFDIMHTLDLGILQHALPSALHELLREGHFGAGSVHAQLKRATREYRCWCRENRVVAQAKRFTPRWVKLPYPQIGQVHAKAAAARSMQYWMRAVCEAAAAAGTPHARARWALFWHLCSADHVMRRAGRHLRRHEQEQLAQRVEAALASYAWLSGRARRRGVPLWALKPKHHAMTHIGFDTQGVNPRRQQCYLDEDMVGKCKRLYTACHPLTASRRCLQRYALGQASRWREALRQLHPWLRKRSRPEA